MHMYIYSHIIWNTQVYAYIKIHCICMCVWVWVWVRVYALIYIDRRK